MNKITITTVAMLLLAGLAVASDSGLDQDWRTKLARKVKPEQRKAFSWSTGYVKGKGNPAVKVKSADPTAYYYDPVTKTYRVLTREESQAMAREHRQRFGDVMKASGYIRRGEFAQAKALLVPMLQEDDLNALASQFLSEALLFEGSYGEALALLAPHVERPTTSNILTKAAYAGAMNGQVFPGQKQYCDENILKYFGNTTGSLESLPQDESLLSARISATLSMATDYYSTGQREHAKVYFLRALDLDPTNALAGFSLGQMFQAQKNLKLALKYSEIGEKHGTGDLQKACERRAASMRRRIRNGGGAH